MSTLSFSQVFKFHANKLKQNCSVSNKGTIFVLLVVYATVMYLEHFEICLYPGHHWQEKCLFNINNNIFACYLHFCCFAPHAQDWLSPNFIHPDWEGSCEVFPADSTTTLPQLPAASHGTAREKHQAVIPCVNFLTGWQLNVSPFVESVLPPGYSGL